MAKRIHLKDSDEPLKLDFDGKTYERPKDQKRLNRQIDEVKALLLIEQEQWWSLAEIEFALDIPQASVSARLRDLRKPRFGGYTVERRRRTEGTFEYRVKL